MDILPPKLGIFVVVAWIMLQKNFLNYAAEKLPTGEHLQDPQINQINVLSNDTQSFEH